MLGLDAAGKTTILYKMGLVVTTIPTIGFNIRTVEASNALFTVWDIGCGRLPLWRHYYEGTDAVVFVVDSTDRERMEETRDKLEIILSDEMMLKKPLLVLSNKVDLPKSLNTTEMTELICLQKYKDREWFIQESCAITGEGILEGFQWLAGHLK